MVSEAGGRPEVSVIIVSWNRRDRLERCLAALTSDPSGGPREILVVDNASRDGSVDVARAASPPVRVIELRRNVGFARANNIAAARARGRALLLLNSDTYVRPGTVGALLDALDRHPRVAVVGPQLRYPDGRLQPSGRKFPTLGTALRSLLPFAPERDPARDYTVPALVDEVSAAAVLIRRAALGRAGQLFDPRFAFFGEDVDLCWRLRRQGWRTLYWPAAVVSHEWGASRERLGHARTAFLAQRAALQLVRGHRSRAGALVLWLLLWPIALARGLRWVAAALGRARPAEAAAIARSTARELRWLAGTLP